VSEDTSYQERLAFAVTGTVLGVTVDPYDRDGRQRAVDAILHYSDGRTAALEVSSTGPDDEAPIQHYLGDRGRSKVISGVAGTWIVELPRRFHPSNMRKVEGALRQCEERGLNLLAELAASDSDASQLYDQDVRALLASTSGSVAYFVLFPTAGPPGGGGLPSEVDTLLGTDKIQSKLAKLADSGAEERHLFLVVLQAAFSLPVFDSLAWGGPLPDGVPRLPEGLGQLWLLTGVVAGGVVRAISGHGWRRDDPYDTIDISALRQ
jgi:hypothetical protein